jgi:DNA-binding transcriptional LysR family regulator
MVEVDLDDVKRFVAVARAGGFREAARAHRTSASVMSEAVRRLEGALGVRLLNRTTRSVATTDAGAALLARLGYCGALLSRLRAGSDRVVEKVNLGAGYRTLKNVNLGAGYSAHPLKRQEIRYCYRPPK